MPNSRTWIETGQIATRAGHEPATRQHVLEPRLQGPEPDPSTNVEPRLHHRARDLGATRRGAGALLN
jgi:hypothetical protein